MKATIRHRNEKGQFAEFEKDKKITREIYVVKRIASTTAKFKNRGGFTGAIVIFEKKRVPFFAGQFVDKGWIYFQGVKIFQLKRGEILTKMQVDNIKQYLAELSGKTKTTEISDRGLISFIKSVIYLDFYPEFDEEDEEDAEDEEEIDGEEF